MQQQINNLLEFQKSFNSIINTKPTLLNKEDWELRYKLSLEELEEYKEACEQGDIVEIFDAILDRLFLAFGDAVSHGLQDKLIEGFNEVVASNMSKLDENNKPIINGENGVWDEKRPLGKILKSKRFFEPRLKEILEREEKPFYPIKKEDRFLCLKDYVMEGGEVAYICGNTYLSERDGYITDSSGDTNHNMDLEYDIDDDTPTYFKKL